ncbi:DNA polymerase I [Corynebacterium ciconiae DSM 44920]|uniref:DNA polymerase I n=1 Tax=Corynebacterium ciconiae TaxID=227319 RepID=UPI0003669493|nr:DNA polymerase I [Corynebacterium ciconiae]WKD61078.1 DNA polymerase I [Corynebacterium ciconiae DSM 44920]
MTDPTPRLMLIDGHSMAFRAFYALPAENFSTSGGQHTNAVYGFMSMFSSLMKEEEPTHVGVAFDVGRTTFRTELFPEYKAQREAAPEEFKGQVDLIKEVLEACNIVTMELENYEADDIVGTITKAAEPEGYEILLVTGDRDYLQLVNEQTTVLYPMKGVSDLKRFTPAAVEEKYGLTPTQYPDFAALRGDPSDNLPNIPLVGEKTAAQWIVKYGSLDGVVEHAHEIGGKRGENLRERLDQVQLNRELTGMVTDLSLDVSPDELKLRSADAAAVAERFDALEFGVNLRERVLAALPSDGAVAEVEHQQRREATLDTSSSLAQWLASRENQPIALAVRGTGVAGRGDMHTLALADSEGSAQVAEIAELGPEDEQALAAWLESDSPKLLHEAKAVYHMVRGRGLTLRGIAHDVAIAAYLLRPGQRTYALGDIYQRHLQRQLDQAENSGQMSLLDDGQSELLAAEAVAIMELAEELTEQLQQIDSFELYRDLELPLVSVLGEVEHTGIAVDIDSLERQRDSFISRVDAEVQAAREIAGDDTLNLSSPKQLQVVLFDTLEMPKTKKTKTGYSTAAKEIENLARTHPHPFLDHLLAHREYQKMKTTLDGLIKAVQPDGRIHTTFNQTVTSTGRLSSTEPNLQNIPVRTEVGREIRSAFVVDEEHECLVTADYSQIEMRVMAHLSEDPGLIEAYRRGEDLHNFVGSRVFGVPVDEVTPEIRRRVKAMSYGLVYGLSAYGLSQQLDISPAEAKDIMSTYFERFGGVKRYLDEVVVAARDASYTATLFGRRRYLPELTSTNRVARENAERAALNAPIQGTAADIIKIAMLRVHQVLNDQRLRSRLLLQVHDELVVEVAPGEKETVMAILREEMDKAVQLSVPLEISAGAGVNWDAAAH